MIHKLDKETIKRIVDLHQEQGLSFPILGERFGVSTTRIRYYENRGGGDREAKPPRNPEL